jgi:hypothetical protein
MKIWILSKNKIENIKVNNKKCIKLPNSALLVFKSLHSFKTLYCIMQRTIKRMYLQHLKRLNHRNPPTFLTSIIDVDHVIGVLHPESQFAEIRQSSFGKATRYLYVLG